MVVPGLINLDFNDVRTVMDEMGKAMMGTGEATGENRAAEAAQSAISNPLLDDVSLKGAKGVLINITGGADLTLFEVHEAATLIRSQVDEDANIIVGSALDNDLDGIIRVSVVATGVEASAQQAPIRASVDYAARRSDDIGQFVPPQRTASAPTHSHAAAAQPQQTLRDLTEDLPPLSAIAGAKDIAPPPMPEASALQADESVSIDTPQQDYSAPISGQVSAPVAAPLAPPVQAAPAAQPSPTATAPQAAPEATRQETAQSVIKRPFRDFFRNKKSLPIARDYQPQPKAKNTGDLFGADLDDELEIPAFLLKAK